MTTPSPSAPDLIGLALRVEASEGNDLDLFRDVGNAVWGVLVESPVWDDSDEPQYSTDNMPAEHWAFERLIDLGAFLDAAVLLVPEGWRWTLFHEGVVSLKPDVAFCGHPDFRENGIEKRADAATPALALVAASLRARSQEQ